MLEQYEKCLTIFLERLHGTEHYADALVYEQRLTENIANVRRYGDSGQRRCERAEIIDRLNQFSLKTLGVAFTELGDAEERRTAALIAEIHQLVTEIHEIMSEFVVQ